MLGIEFHESAVELRRKLLFEQHVFTGFSGTSMLRLLAPLVTTRDDVDTFVSALSAVL
jgi:acetylornithine aminotransferase